MTAAQDATLLSKVDYLKYATQMSEPQFKRLMELYQVLDAQRSWDRNNVGVENLSFTNGMLHYNFRKQTPRSGVKVGLMGDKSLDRQSFEYFRKYQTQFVSFLFRKNASEH